MLRWFLLAGIGFISISQSNAQLKKFYSLKESSSYDTVRISFEASVSSCHIKNTTHSSPLNIYGNPDLNKINPTYHTKVSNNTCNVFLRLEEYQSSSFDEDFSFSTFFTGKSKSKKVEKDFWQMYLSDEKVYDLNLRYGMGEAFLDFSGVAVSNVKINTGGANVKVDYSRDHANPVKMETFSVKVDLGSFEANKVSYLNAKKIITEVGVGKAVLNFKEGTHQKCDIQASVGAGSLEVILPAKDVPVIIYISDSPLCGIKIAEGFEEVEKNTYVNMNYSADAKNLHTFKIDVALGNIIFRH